ncbi:condensation domain protein [Mycobacterium ulcerans str. Harvey]|uniref:Condensation domain protein n=1 Tax=Mycobacterium ulcerans str. Harvey TaxID=1299332 RepID=A0ABP3A8D8_MYCUL|nr:condensation domain protein [Mycobacterium ulcerans str. Harvey]
MAAEQSSDQPRICPGERYRLSDGQRRMWFLQTMDPDDVTLNICVAYRLTGLVDEDRLHTAVNDVVARHAILRTTYGWTPKGSHTRYFRRR